jgi:predicted phosphate transport protein (TIGR00153 family)
MAVRNPLVDVFAKSPVRPIQEHMHKVLDTAKGLPTFVNAAQKGDWKKAEAVQKEIVMHERHADKLKHLVRTHVPKRLFMPVSRSDLLQLVTTQDRIANRTKDVAGLMLGRKMQFPKPLATQFKEYIKACLDVAKQACEAIDTLDEVFEVGFSRREVKTVDAMIKEISKREKATDKLQIKLRAELFKIEQDLPPVEVMFLYKIIELIGDIADYSERTGNRLQILISL